MSSRMRWDDLPLFADDQEIGLAVLGPVRSGEFKGIATLLENHGFPKIDPRMGARFTPAVRRFWEAEYGMADKPRTPGGIERPEAWIKKPKT